jgi:tetratricopeptide (TPR) repeat protein
LPFSPKKVDGRGFSSTERYKDPSSYLWLLPGPLVFLIFFLTGRKKTILGVSIIFIAASGQVVTNQAVDIGIVQYERGEYHSSIESFQQASTELKNNSYLSYNLALAYYQLGDYGKSIYEARNAFYHDPFNSEYRNLVNYVELKGEILYPIDLSFNLYPDAFLFLLMILVNISAFIGVIYLVSSKNIYFISSVLLLGLSVMAIGGLGFSVIQKDRQVGIIIQDSVPVKKIPIQEGETILDMKSGESVLIKGDSNDYLFINTGTGIKGWIDKSDLIIIKD